MPIISSRSKGSDSESLAQEYLTSKGFIFIEKNYSSTLGELDLIMKSEDFIVFIEVKSLTSDKYYSIYNRLTLKKKQKIRKTIYRWLRENNLSDALWRFDFVGIVNKKEVEHFEFVSL